MTTRGERLFYLVTFGAAAVLFALGRIVRPRPERGPS